MPTTVLITGVSRFLGSRLAAQLAADPSVERVIGIDTRPPRTSDLPLLGRTEFVRADIRNPLIAKVITQARVTTVVHGAVMPSLSGVGGGPMQEMNVIGTMQLLAACQKSDTVERLVLKSTTAIYGCSPHDPAVFTEDMAAAHANHIGFAKDAVEVEGYVRGFGRRRPDIGITVLRLANVLGPTIDNALTRYLAMPVVPSAFGYDPRLQLLHESDAIEALRLAAVTSRPGLFNVAGDGVVPLSQLVRRAGRVRLPVPKPAIGLAGAIVRNAGVAELGGEGPQYLAFGRAVDTTALRERFGYRPQFTTAQTAQAYFDAHGRLARPMIRGLGAAARAVRSAGDRRLALQTGQP